MFRSCLFVNVIYLLPSVLPYTVHLKMATPLFKILHHPQCCCGVMASEDSGDLWCFVNNVANASVKQNIQDTIN